MFEIFIPIGAKWRSDKIRGQLVQESTRSSTPLQPSYRRLDKVERVFMWPFHPRQNLEHKRIA